MANTLILSGVGGKTGVPLAAVAIAPTRLSGRGEAAWSMRADARQLRQPQDGAPDSRARVATLRPKTLIGVLQEPEDATLTGGTRSLKRRLLGLNVEIAHRRTPAVVSGSTPRAKVA